MLYAPYPAPADHHGEHAADDGDLDPLAHRTSLPRPDPALIEHVQKPGTPRTLGAARAQRDTGEGSLSQRDPHHRPTRAVSERPRYTHVSSHIRARQSWIGIGVPV
ncbi:hypothetical protein SALBM217S_04140 [Streptomyces griseoloalbus]